jgi:asparagine synthase (glutamine-hydrolysing)
MRGMFTFCLVDEKKNLQFLVRDRFGIKPLYYTKNTNRIAFASEIKAFYKMTDYKPLINDQALPEYYLYNKMLDYSTLLKDTYEVKPGTYIKIDNIKISEHYYYSLVDIHENGKISEDEALEELERLLTESIKLRLVSDVPIGVFLSGGIDSSVIAVIMSKLNDTPIKTISAGYKEEEANEFYWSDQVVKKIQSDHHKFLDNSNDFFNLLPWLTYIFDKPLQTGVAFYKAAKFAKETCTVMLCGQGSDEIFGGYSIYRNAYKQYKINSIIQSLTGKNIANTLHHYIPKIGKQKIFRKVGARVDLSDHQIAASYYGDLPQEDFIKILSGGSQNMYYELLDRFSLIWPDRPDMPFVKKMLMAGMNLGLQGIVQNTDRMTMAASVETRVPFLDHHLVEFVYSLPTSFKIRNGEGKHLLKRYLSKFFDDEFLYRPKKGFPVPYTRWFLDEKTEFKIPTQNAEILEKCFNLPYFESYTEIVKSGLVGKNSDAVSPMLRYYALHTWIKMLETYDN